MTHSPPLLVGNDVIDLGSSRYRGRGSRSRLLERICTGAEATRIVDAPHPDRAFCLTWAAKEAAFKVATKQRGRPPPFEHAAFEVHPEGVLVVPGPAGTRTRRGGGADEGASGGGGRTASEPTTEGAQAGYAARREGSGTPRTPLHGTVRWEDLEIPFLAGSRDDWLHVVAWWAPEGSPLVELLGGAVRLRDADVEAAGASLPPEGPRILTGVSALASAAHPDEPETWHAQLEASFSPRERPAVHSAASAQVRLEAREGIRKRMGVGEDELEIVCEGDRAGRVPPRLLRNGRPSDIDVTLSHDGRWVAWAAGAGAGLPASGPP